MNFIRVTLQHNNEFFIIAIFGCGNIFDQRLLFDHKQLCIWPLELSEHYEPGNHSKNQRLKPLRNSLNVSRTKFDVRDFWTCIHANSPGLSGSLPDAHRSPALLYGSAYFPDKITFWSFLYLSLRFNPFLAQNVNFSYSQYGFWGLFARI